MKDLTISVLRDRNATLAQYRQAAEQLGTLLAIESSAFLPKAVVTVETPLGSTSGKRLESRVILVPILRSGLIFLSPFLQFYPEAHIGFIGARRDEKTADPHLYYSKLPLITAENPILLLDPMLATGGSSCLAVDVLKKAGAVESQIALVSAIAAPEGISRLKKEHPGVSLIVTQVDEKLDKNKFIYPGLGDFGDRYFGT